MQETKLTQEQITSMSEVVAKYMGWKYHYDLHGKICIKFELDHYYRLDMDWNVIHEVWEKLKLDENFKNTILYDPIVSLLAFGTKEQVFTAIYNAIKFINEKSI